ncbi:MAG: hypothetical protein JW944_08035, partial [Deltaproteobacteria bacterium]|nr:hypothetical protein [Deltaproteobacteria bacterium]
FFFSFCPAYSYPDNEIHYHYREQVKESVDDVELILEETESGCILTCKKTDEFSVSVNDATLATLEWSFTKTGDSVLKVKREGDFLTVTGIFKGKEIHERLPIDERPWYQATSLSLRTLVLSNDKEKVFWTLRPDNMSPVKFRAVKEAEESITVGGKPYDAVRIEMRPAGIKSVLWKGVYWFREADGVFLRFQGAAAIPGMAASEITFVE